jgi:hypothetical protein
MEGPWDPIVALHEAISRRFTRASPFVLFTGVSLGVQFSAQMYGAVAMWVFAGREPLLDFMFGSDLNGMHPRRLKFSRVGNAAILMNVAPALLIGHLLPGVGNKIFVPTASLVHTPPPFVLRCARRCANSFFLLVWYLPHHA